MVKGKQEASHLNKSDDRGLMHAAGKAQVAGRNRDGAEGTDGEAVTHDLN